MMALSGVRSSCDMVARNSDFMRLACSSSMFFSCKRALEALALGHVARRANTPCSLRSRSWKVAALYDTTVSSPLLGAHRQLVVADLVLGEHALDRGVGPHRVGEEVPAGRADQFVARATR